MIESVDYLGILLGVLFVAVATKALYEVRREYRERKRERERVDDNRSR